MVTVIIVNWNGGELLKQCVAHLDRQTLRPSRIIVVDNCSSDGSVDDLPIMDEINVKKLPYNTGFSKANNYALSEVDTEYVALLNPDAFPERDWLEKLVDAAKTYPNVAAFGSTQLMSKESGIIDGIGDCYHFSGRVYRKGYGHFLRSENDKPRIIFSACGAASLYRTNVLNEVGGFDEEYFCYIEDVDLGFRMSLMGWYSMYIPDALVYHIGSVSSGGRHSDFSVYHGHRNLVWTYVKNMPGLMFWVCLPAHILMNIVAVIWCSMRGQGKVVLKAKRDALLGMPNMWRKRKAIQKKRRTSTYDIWRLLDKRLIPFRKYL